jgi:hypothetical protein
VIWGHVSSWPLADIDEPTVDVSYHWLNGRRLELRLCLFVTLNGRWPIVLRRNVLNLSLAVLSQSARLWPLLESLL